MQTDSNSNSSTSAETLRLIPLALITSSSTNPRQEFPPDGIASLADSIRQHGVLQAILVRQIAAQTDGEAFEIVAGERRFRAAKLAEQPHIPARIVEMSDEEVLQVQIIENLQREDVHPLDEANGFLHLKEAMQLDLTDIAQRIAKDVRYVARRLSLVNLIEEAQVDFRKDFITLAHALEICRLSPEIQHEALIACYERKSVFDEKEQTYKYAPDKQRPARHVRYVQDWLEQNVHLNLLKAPFKLDDTRLREDGLPCISCPQRTGFNTGLFADIKNGDTCLNPGCFKGKVQTLVQIRKAELDRKRETPAAYISPYYGTRIEGGHVLTTAEYRLIERKVERCEYAEQAVYVEGEHTGAVKWICREAKCKDHLGRYNYERGSTTGATSGTSRLSSTASIESRNKRKQELFDMRVDEVVRQRVMSEAVKTYKYPFERAHLNQVACEFFRRVPSSDQRTVIEVFGWNDDVASGFRTNESKMLAELGKLNTTQLAQLMMLCSFAHFGANQYMNSQVSQEAVVKLAKEQGVNHKLIDAQARLELAAKKYKPQHQAYLDAVTKGKTAKKPIVFTPSQTANEPIVEADAPVSEVAAPATTEATANQSTKKATVKNNVTTLRTKKPQQQPRKQPATEKQMKKTA